MTTPHLTTPHLAAGAAPTPGLRRWLLPSAIVVGLAMIGVGLATSTAYWTGAFAHELRTQRHGGEIVATTIAGARWWRAALVAGGVLIPAMIAVLDRRIGAAPSPSADTRGIAGDPARSRRGLTAAGLAVLALLALALRLPRLTESLWYDEIADFLAFGAFGPGATMGNYFTPSNHVLSGILCWASVTLAGGANEAVLRLPALFASLATVPACWWLAREATVESGRPRAAALLPWIVALLAAVAPVLLLSVEARGYAIMILSSALATALLLRGTRRGEGAGTGDVQLRIWILYAIVVSLGTWAHLVTACVAVGHAALLAADLRVAVRRRAAFAGLLAVALAATLTLILYSPLLPDLLSIRGQFKASDGDEPTLLGPEGLHSLLQMGGAWSWWAALPGIAMATLGAIATTGDAALRRAVVASLLGAVAAVVLAWAGDSWLYARFLLFAMPAALLLIAAGVTTMVGERAVGRNGARRATWRRALAAAALLLVVGSWMADLALRPPKQPLREAIAVVANAKRPGDRVATIGLADNVLDWYGSLRGVEVLPSGPLGREISAVLDRQQPSWVIVLYERSVPPERFAELAERGFSPYRRLPGWVDWGNGDVVIYRRSTER
jgi:hypothetical protein